MPETESKGGSAGSVLTGIAAVITALATLIAIFHDPKHQETPPAATAAQSHEPSSTETSSQPLRPGQVEHATPPPASRPAEDASPEYADVSKIIGPWHLVTNDTVTLHLVLRGVNNLGYMDSPCADEPGIVRIETATFEKNLLRISYHTTEPPHDRAVSEFIYKNHQLIGGMVGTTSNGKDATATLIPGAARCTH